MLKVGLTGGIGSGKTTVLNIFACLGVPVLNIDQLAQKIMHQNKAVVAAIISAFGDNAYQNSVLNRPYLSNIVFSDPSQLAVLNAIIHPATISATKDWINQQNAPYIIKESALFFESGSVEDMDYMIGVTAPQSIRIKRVMDRDGIDREAVQAKMSQQIDDGVKMKLCDFVIFNYEDRLLIPQIFSVHQQLIAIFS